ncbi:MAG: anti-sigma factor family protein [Armatimonadota bacterium]
MKCEQIQPNLLDYSEGRLSQPEFEEVRAHIGECAECAALLEEEIAFSKRLSALPAEQPTNDVWALVRARTKPKRVGLLVTLADFMRSGYRRAAAAIVVAMLVLVSVYSFAPTTDHSVKPSGRSATVQQVKWSDDPMGTQTDAMIEFIDNM